MEANIITPAAQINGPDAGFSLDVVHDNKDGGLVVKASTHYHPKSSIYISDGVNRAHITLPISELVRLWEELNPIVVNYIKDDCRHNNPQKRMSSDNT